MILYQLGELVMITKTIKKAFTIAEALVTFTLMGTIFVITISNLNISATDNYTKLYWQAFNTLYQASKSVYQDWQKEVSETCLSCVLDCNLNTCYKASCWRGNKSEYGCDEQERLYLGGTTNIGRDFPGFLFNNNINNALAGRGQDEKFCEKLTGKINSFPASRCKSFISIANPNKLENDGSKNKGVNFLNAFSYAIDKGGGVYEPVNEKGGISPSFIALNGQRFYISSVVTANSPKALGTAWTNFEHPTRESYRFVVVDLNGDSKPNSQFQTGFKNPDIVLFAINSVGDVIPLGLPEFSKSYMNVVVYHPNDLKEDGTRMYPKIKSDPSTLWYAKGYAFGNETCGGAAQPLPYGSAVSSVEPFSQSAKFYATATHCSKNGIAACADRNVAEDGVYADTLFTHLVMQFLYRKEDSAELYPYLKKSECVKNSAENGCTTIQNDNEAPACAIDIVH